MTDYFALLNEPRRPWLEPEPIKQKFLALSATVHPDRVHNLGEAERAAAQERYTELNAAYNCLREPRERLQHLLKLELGALPRDIQRIPSDLMDLSLEVGKACRDADTFLAEKEKVTSPLLQVTFFERSEEFRDRLQALRQRANTLNDQLNEELKRTDTEWLAGAETHLTLLPRLEELYRLFSYFARWTAQIQERIVRLSF
ncbi:MAG TPA: DnaJ domain-containing protein [Verrucomicrobiae bacterium]|nr:DnaJ domain-containing protein [Verrucomicrobiae bacterium]